MKLDRQKLMEAAHSTANVKSCTMRSRVRHLPSTPIMIKSDPFHKGSFIKGAEFMFDLITKGK